MKKILFLAILLISFTQLFSQKFVWGNLKVSGSTYVNKNLHVTGNIYSDSLSVGEINDSLSVPYLKADSLMATKVKDSLEVSYLKTDSLLATVINDSLTVSYLKTDSLQATTINDSLSVSYLKTDSVLLTAQNVKYVSGFTLPTGSLTDGTPTEAEITAIVGSPASKGEGYRAIIEDSDGSGLLYLIVSDGTGWNYIALTLAL